MTTMAEEEATQSPTLMKNRTETGDILFMVYNCKCELYMTYNSNTSQPIIIKPLVEAGFKLV